MELQPRAFAMLAFMVAAGNRVVTREEILAAVWHGQVVAANNLTVQMSALRRVLAEHGGDDLIVTVPGRGYRFAGQVVQATDACSVCPEEPAAARLAEPAAMHDEHAPVLKGRNHTGRRWRLWAAGAPIALVVLAAVGLSLGSHARAPARFAAHVQVEAIPDIVVMTPDGYCRVDYRFHLTDAGELQLNTEDVQFYLTSGEPVSQPSVRGRIYRGSFPITGPGAGVYRNNLYLPATIVAAARAKGHQDVYLRHLFHLTDPEGHEVDVPAVVQIVFGAPGCASGK